MPLSRQSSSPTRLSYSSSLSSVSAAAGDPCTVTLAFLPLTGPRRAQPLQLTQAGRAVFSGSVRPRQRLSFVSQRRPPQPFALTAQLGELTAVRVSVCCERRRPPGARLGGAASPLVVVDVSGGSGPCGRCLAASDRRLKQHQKQVDKLDRRLKRIFLAARVGIPAAAAAVKDRSASQEPAADNTEREQDGMPPREANSDTTETNDTQHTTDTNDTNDTEPTPSSSDRSASQTDDSDSENESDSEAAEVEEAPSEADESIKTESDSESESVREVLPA